MREQLKQFKMIGWDFDGTLIDHPNSQKFWDYISENPYKQEHYIVTFRSGNLVDFIFPDLKNRGSSLNEYYFKDVFTCPMELWMNHQSRPKNDPYIVWKGLVCSAHNIPVLIDDMTAKVIKGCQQYGITHYHPDDL